MIKINIIYTEGYCIIFMFVEKLFVYFSIFNSNMFFSKYILSKVDLLPLDTYVKKNINFTWKKNQDLVPKHTWINKYS